MLEEHRLNINEDDYSTEESSEEEQEQEAPESAAASEEATGPGAGGGVPVIPAGEGSPAASVEGEVEVPGADESDESDAESVCQGEPFRHVSELFRPGARPSWFRFWRKVYEEFLEKSEHEADRRVGE